MAASLAPVTRDQPDYWRRRPRDHGFDGLYREGPRGDGCPLGRWVKPIVTPWTPGAPDVVLAQQAHERQQARRRAQTRANIPAPAAEHPRRCKKTLRVVGKVRRG